MTISNRNRTRAITALLALGVLLAGPGPARAEDYLLHPEAESIQEGVEEGLVVLEDGAFRPDEELTRETWVSLLSGYLGLNRLAAQGFEDLAEDNPHYEDFLVAREAGLIEEDEDGAIFPQAAVSREEAAESLYGLLGDVLEQAPRLATIEDAGEIAPERVTAVRWMVDHRFLKLDTQGRVDPASPMRRADAVAVLDRITGLRLGAGEVLGNALDTTTVSQNITVLGAGATIRRVETAHDLLVMQTAGGGTLTLNKVELTGDLVVLGAGDVTLELEDSNVARVRTRNPYGTVRLVRDARSHVSQYDQGTPLTLEVKEEAGGEQTLQTGLAVRPIALGMGALLIGLVVYKSRRRETTRFVSRGVGKYIRMPGVRDLSRVGILNPDEDVALVEIRGDKLRIEGRRPGRVRIELFRRSAKNPAQLEEPPAHGARMKRHRGSVFLNVVVVEPPAARNLSEMPSSTDHGGANHEEEQEEQMD